MKIRLKYVVEDVDRHGNVRLYFRRNGKKTRLPNPVGSPEFLAAYKAAFAGESKSKVAPKVGQIVPGSVRALCADYYKSAMFRGTGPREPRRCGGAFLSASVSTRTTGTSPSRSCSRNTSGRDATR